MPHDQLRVHLLDKIHCHADHDPVRTDDELDSAVRCATAGLEVFAAREGLVVEV